MKIVKRIFLSILILAVLSTAIIYIFRKKITGYFTPEIEQYGDILVDVRDDTCYIYPTLVLTNESFLDLEIDTIRYDISIYETTYWHSQKSLDIKMPAHGTDTLKFCVKIPYKDLKHDSAEEREKGDSTELSINISFQVKTFFGERDIVINKTRQIKIPTLPEIKVVDMTYTKVRLNQIDALARIRAINHGNIAIVIKDLNYVMTIFSEGSLSGKYEKPVLIAPHQTTYVEIPVEITPDHLGKTLFAVLTDNDNYDYTLLLNGTLESTDAAEITFKLEVRTEGKMELRKDEVKEENKDERKDERKEKRKNEDAEKRE